MAEGLRFEPFDKARHARESFDCGVPEPNEYVRTKLNQQMKRGVTLGYVLASPDGEIAGYVTLSAGALSVGAIPTGHGFPLVVPLPTALIGRLAVSTKYQGQGLGGDLLTHAMRIAVETAEKVALAVIEVDAINNAARRFYAKYGFASLPDDPLHLYLPMADARVWAAKVFGSR